VRIQVLFSIIDLISLSMASFQKGDSEEFIASLKEIRSPSTRYINKSSPKDVRILVLLLLLGSKLVAGAELKEKISEIKGVQEGLLGILDLKEKIFKADNISNFNDGVVGYFTNLKVTH